MFLLFLMGLTVICLLICCLFLLYISNKLFNGEKTIFDKIHDKKIEKMLARQNV